MNDIFTMTTSDLESLEITRLCSAVSLVGLLLQLSAYAGIYIIKRINTHGAEVYEIHLDHAISNNDNIQLGTEWFNENMAALKRCLEEKDRCYYEILRRQINGEVISDQYFLDRWKFRPYLDTYYPELLAQIEEDTIDWFSQVFRPKTRYDDFFNALGDMVDDDIVQQFLDALLDSLLF